MKDDPQSYPGMKSLLICIFFFLPYIIWVKIFGKSPDQNKDGKKTGITGGLNSWDSELRLRILDGSSEIITDMQ